MSPLVIVVALDLGEIFYFFLVNVSVSTRYKEAMAMTIHSAILALRTSFILILMTSLALVGGRLLILATRCVSERSVSKLSSSNIFLLLFCRLVLLRYLESILWVLKADCSNTFAFALMTLSTASSQVSSSWPQISNYAWMEGLKFFLEISDHYLFVSNYSRMKLLEDCL